MTYSNITGRITGVALIALVLLTLAIAPVSARAADASFDYGYDIYDYSSPSSDYGYDYGYDIYDYSYGSDYSYGYDTYDYSYGSSYTPGYSYYTPGYSSGSSYSSASAVSSVYAPTNTCTAPNSCNDNSVFNAPTVVTVTDYDNDNDDDRKEKKRKRYDDDDRKVVYQHTPYVTLSQVPYTGLELGPMGTAAYWSFLVLWSLIAAYLIVVKRVQVKIFNGLNRFLFGDAAPASLGHSHTGVAAAPTYRKSTQTTAPAAPAPSDDSTDDFIVSQINRSRN